MSAWLEKYRFYIVIFLIAIILAGVVVLLWQKRGVRISSNANQEVRVDVSGAVNKPGVYSLRPGSILEDAIQMASGFSENADADRVAKEFNRAEILKDGQKIYIPFKGENS